jgi:hypothetical protein
LQVTRKSGTVQLSQGRNALKGVTMSHSSNYNPRFDYGDFDTSYDDDDRIFNMNLSKLRRQEKKVQKTEEVKIKDI